MSSAPHQPISRTSPLLRHSMERLHMKLGLAASPDWVSRLCAYPDHQSQDLSSFAPLYPNWLRTTCQGLPYRLSYRLWDTADGSIFNSFHVTFVEHLDQQPVDLLPGTTISIEPDAAPSWDASPPPTPPSLSIPSDNASNTIPSSSSLGENRQIITPSM